MGFLDEYEILWGRVIAFVVVVALVVLYFVYPDIYYAVGNAFASVAGDVWNRIVGFVNSNPYLYWGTRIVMGIIGFSAMFLFLIGIFLAPLFIGIGIYVGICWLKDKIEEKL